MSQYKGITLEKAICLLETEFEIFVKKENIEKDFADIINAKNLDSFDTESRKIEYYETAIIY